MTAYNFITIEGYQTIIASKNNFD